jgi:hypothetical protein
MVHKSRVQIVRATEFCVVGPNVRGPSVWNLLHVIFLASRVLRRLVNFGEIFAPAWL